jgi:TIR domain
MSEKAEAKRSALFISHANPEDNHFVRWLGAKLAAMGYEVWADVMSLQGGDDWARKLEEALRNRALKMLLVCTPTGIEKQGVRNEIQIGSDLSKKLGDKGFIIPLRLEDFESPFLTVHLQYINFKNSWASGLAELTELLNSKSIPHGPPGPMQTWLDLHAEGASKLLQKTEPLVSNWLEVRSHPKEINYCEPPVGFGLERFHYRKSHIWPVVPFQGGVITFAEPDSEGNLGPGLPGKVISSIKTSTFLDNGWDSYGIDSIQARKMYTDLGGQAFDKYCAGRNLKGYMVSGNRLSWWADIKTAPLGKVKFDWNYRRGSRKIIGHSDKRNIHWHYAVSTQLRTSPLRHLRVTAHLVFSQNGMDAIEDKRRAHVLRRSFAKGWRNARWRDMLCAYLWWLSDDKYSLQLPAGDDEFINLKLPPKQFSSPVTVDETGQVTEDEDDPNIPIDDWTDDDPQEESEE